MKCAVYLPAAHVDHASRTDDAHLLAYIDDVIVYSRHYFQHLRDIRAVFERLRVAGLKLKPSKCQLFRDEVLYVGHVVNAAGVSPDPAKIRV